MNNQSEKHLRNKEAKTSPLEHGIPWFQHMDLLSSVSHPLRQPKQLADKLLVSLLKHSLSGYTPLLFSKLALETAAPVKCRDIGLV